MKSPLAILSILLVLLAACVATLYIDARSSGNRSSELLVHCAAGLHPVLEEIAEAYEQEFGIQIRINVASSGALAAQLQTAGGDLYFPADPWYIEQMQARGLVETAEPFARMHACMVVPTGNPQRVNSLDHLYDSKIRISMADPSAAAGKFVRETLIELQRWDQIEPSVVVTKPTVNAVVSDVQIGAVDVGLAWDAVANEFDGVDIVRVPAFDARPREIQIGLIRGAKTPAAADFLRYVTAIDRGQRVARRHGFYPLYPQGVDEL